MIEHVNAEISLGTITNSESASKWLASTFLAVRLKADPDHYHMRAGASCTSHKDRLDTMSVTATSALREHGLVDNEAGRLSSTRFGETMARYYIAFETMKLIIGLPEKAKISEIVRDSMIWKEVLT